MTEPTDRQGDEPRPADLCYCGGGRAFANCHGSSEYEAMISRGAEQARLMAQLQLKRDSQRQHHQGLGRPILSLLLPDGRRFVAVGARQFSGTWKTFPDFLMTYISRLFGLAWGNAELARTGAERHPLLNWYQAVCSVQASASPDEEGMRQAPITDLVWRYLGLANDLYCIEHNANTPPVWERLLHRLRTPESFFQASYEVLAAAAFVRAGFTIDFEDDTDSSRKHVEFFATDPRTKRRFAVECKRRRDEHGSGKLRVVSHLNRALDQNQTELPLIVFIEMDQPSCEDVGPIPRQLLEGVLRLEEWADDPRASDRLPAYIILTNQPLAEAPDASPSLVGYLHGFKIPELRFREFGPLSELVAARDKHPEVHALMGSMRKHSRIPNSFDGQEPHSNPGLQTPLDYYDFMFEMYQNMSREQLLKCKRGHSDEAQAQAWTQSELVNHLALRWAMNFLAHQGKVGHDGGQAS